MKNYCIDCGKEIYRYSKKCINCYHKNHIPWNKGKKLKSLSEKHKKAISDSLIGEKHPRYGKHLSDNHKKKISDTKKGKYTGEDNPFYGKHHSRKIKELLRLHAIGNKNVCGKHWKLSEKTKEKMKEKAKGRKFSKKSKIKMSKSASTLRAIKQALKNGYGKKCYYEGEFFPSLLEKDCYIKLRKLGFKVIHNFLNRFDFLVNKKVVVEFHPYDRNGLTDKQYYNQRRRLLNEYGHKDLKLVVIKDLKNLKDIKVLERQCQLNSI